MKKSLLYTISAVISVVAISHFTLAAAPSVSSPTCSLSVSPTPIELLRTTPVNLVWNSTGGDKATLKVDAWSQSNIFSTTGLSGNITTPVKASMGLAATLTVTKSNPYGVATCKVGIPTFWVVKK